VRQRSEKLDDTYRKKFCSLLELGSLLKRADCAVIVGFQ
jgi:hypothetical protein